MIAVAAVDRATIVDNIVLLQVSETASELDSTGVISGHSFELNDNHMNTASQPLNSRREFLKNTSRFAAVSAPGGVALPHVHAAGSDTIQVALIG